MNNLLEIEKCLNGWIIKNYEEVEEGKFNPIKELIVDTEGHEGMTNLLTKVAEYFGVCEDRYGNKNLKISFDREGSKYENKN